MSTREVVTLQLGHYANFIGTHWWNIQESSFVYEPQSESLPKEVNHDVLFREGQTLHGEVTYTPRLVAVDLKGSLRSLKREGTLYEAGKEEDVKWEADVSLHESVPEKKNDFLEDLDKVEAEQVTQITDSDVKDSDTHSQTEAVFGHKLYDLDDSIQVWSDYLRLHLHPKSLHVVQEYIHNNEEQPFDVFNFGSKVLANQETFETLENQIRFFVEECDQLQGFHVLLDWCDGFGGLGATVLQHLEDEYSSKARFTCAVSPAQLPDTTARQRANRIINCALSLDKGSNSSSLFVPMTLAESLWKTVGPTRKFPYLNFKGALDYHSSSVLAATLDTMSMPYRKQEQASCMADITGAFNNRGRKVSALYSSLPFPLETEGSFVESLLNHKGQAPWFSLTPHVGSHPSPYMQSCVIRGVPHNRVNRVGPSANVPGILSGVTSLQDILQLYLTETHPQCLNAGCVMRDPCGVTSPFPHIFTPEVSRTGFVSPTARPACYGVDSVAIMTSLQSNDAIHNLIGSLHQEAARFNIRKHHRYLDAGLEEDEYAETLDNISELAHCYRSDTSIS